MKLNTILKYSLVLGLPAFSRTPTTDDDIQSSLERLRQRIQDRKPLNPQQQSIHRVQQLLTNLMNHQSIVQ